MPEQTCERSLAAGSPVLRAAENEVIAAIGRLPISHAATRNHETEERIATTAAMIVASLVKKGLRVSAGSTSPSKSKSYARIYLEPVDSTTHDSRHDDYSVLRYWEWQTRKGGRFKPISHREVRRFCDELIAGVEAA